MTQFNAQVFHNGFLAEGATTIDAVVTVTAVRGETESAPAVSSSAERVEVITVDVSGSMESPSTKIREARKAVAAAVDVIADGTWFAIVAGSDYGTNVYPGEGLIQANAETRAAAKKVAAQLSTGGGTNIPGWLDATREIVEGKPGAMAHCLLLTDGNIEPRDLVRTHLPQAIERCKGVLEVDCRGVGADWVVDELRQIADALLGTVDIIKSASGMEVDFRAIIEASMAKVVSPDLSVWAPKGGTVEFVKQVAPSILALAADAAKAPNALTGVYPTGSWADGESRDYHIRITLPAAGAVGEQKAAARVKVVVGDTELVQQLVSVTWTDDLNLSTKIVKEVAHYTGQAELAEAVQEGLAARAAGDEATATAKLGRAAQLAAESGNEDMTNRLKKVVDIEDAESGTVRLKKDVQAADAMALDTGSTRTVRAGGKKK